MKLTRSLACFAISTLILFSMMGCISVSNITTTSGVEESLLSNIPEESKLIIVDKKNISADSLYEEIYTILLSRGHRISKDDKSRHYITTEGKGVGQSTIQRMTVVVTENGNDSKMKITTEWKAGTEATATASSMSGMAIQSEWGPAKWEVNRLGIAFAESVAIASKIKNGNISYQ